MEFELTLTFWLLLAYGLLEATGIFLAVLALLWARTAQGATAWAVALITVPILAVPAFVIFGSHRFQGYVSKRRSSDARLDKEWKEFASYFERARCFKKGESQTIDVFEKLAEIPFTRAQSVRLLKDGEELFPELKRAMDKAREFIDFQFYVLRDDQIGREIAEVLERKARAGVKVRVLYDDLGSGKTSDAYFERLRKAGIEVAPFVSTRFRLSRFRYQINFRNHRKLVNIDNRTLFVGGMNVGDDYLSRYPKIGRWRDTHLVVEGSPAVQAQQSFVADWYWSTKKVIDFKSANVPWAEAGVPVLILATSPVGMQEAGSLAMLNAVHSARKRLWIASPYFVPDEQIVAALQLASLRGVDVRVLGTEKTDQIVTQLAAHTFLDELLPLGVKFFKYRPGFMHQKVVLVDDELAYVGSTNFDNRSFRLNFEIGAWVHDGAFAREVEKMLADDFAVSEEVTMKVVKEMPIHRQIACGLARLLAPAL